MLLASHPVLTFSFIQLLEPAPALLAVPLVFITDKRGLFRGKLVDTCCGHLACSFFAPFGGAEAAGCPFIARTLGVGRDRGQAAREGTQGVKPQTS